MKNFVNTGLRSTIIAAAAAASGDLVVVGIMFGVAANSAQAGEELVLDHTGVYDFVAKSADTAVVGSAAYWDAATKSVTTTASDNTKIGVFVAAKLANETTSRIRLNSAY